MNLDCFGSGARFHHVGVAVNAIQDVCPTCQPTYDAIQGVNVAFISLNGCHLELIEPAREDSPVSASLKKGINLLHICYEVDDIEAALRKCRQHGFHIIRQPTPATAFDQRRIAFIFSRTFGVVELLERGRKA
jgi:methylmalonyl-CoA/ethylmalonyl-CoA epimerase